MCVFGLLNLIGLLCAPTLSLAALGPLAASGMPAVFSQSQAAHPQRSHTATSCRQISCATYCKTLLAFRGF